MKKWAAIFLGLLMVFSMAPVTAEERGQAKMVCETYIPSDGMTGEEAMNGYILKKMYSGKMGLAFRERSNGATASNYLNVTEKKLYDALKPLIQQAAAGEITNTRFELPSSVIYGEIAWTAEDLGLPSLGESEEEFAGVYDAFRAKLDNVFPLDNQKVMDALVLDFPYDMYWFDKTYGMNSLMGIVTRGNTVCLPETLTWSFAVAKEYSATNTIKTYELNTKWGQSVQKARENAQTIVTAHAGKGDLAKLTAYKEEICKLNTYNHKAADDSSMSYGNPWQLIYVFDGDASTNVVCEGYSKAFQYLCDLSTFQGSVTVISVSGGMGSGNDGAIELGAHMWNVVNMGGKRYLADITSCDDYSVGAPDYVFMKGYVAYDPEQKLYTYNGKGDFKIYYRYEDRITGLLGAEELAVSGESYPAEEAPEDPENPEEPENPDNPEDPKQEEIIVPKEKYQLNSKKTAVIFVGSSDKNADSLVIADTVQIGGIEYKVTEIAAGACKGMKKLTSIVIGKNVKTIGEKAFNGCKALISVTGGSAVTAIGNSAFASCQTLTTLPEFKNLQTIGDSAFSKCGALETVILGSKVKGIGKNAFKGCRKLKTILIRSTKLTDGNVKAGAFKDVADKPTVKVTKSKLKKYRTLLVKKGIPAKATFKTL